MYESIKKELSCEIYIIEGVQFNFKVDDIQKLLGVDDLILFKKYLYYLNNFRINNLYVESYDDALNKFKEEIDEDEIVIEDLIKIFIKHEYLFCNEKGVKQLKYVPKEYNNKIFNY